MTTLNFISAPGSLTKAGGTLTIGSSAFYDCDGLTDVIFPRGAKVSNNNAFNNCDKIVFYISDTYANARTNLPIAMQPTTRPHLYYAEYIEDKDTDTSIRYWHYENGVPTEWVPDIHRPS